MKWVRVVVFSIFMSRALASPMTMVASDSVAASERKVLVVSPVELTTPTQQVVPGDAQSLAGALQSARTLRANGWKGTIILHLLPGIYRVNPGITLSEADSGLADAPLIIEGEVRDQVRITGGNELKKTKLSIDDPVASRLPSPLRRDIIAFDLKASGVSSWVGMTERGVGVPDKEFSSDLLWNGAAMTPARWPNSGFAKITSVSGPDNSPTIRISPRIPANWRSMGQIWAEGYWHYDWSDQLLPARIIANDSLNLTHAPLQYGVVNGERFYLEGFPEALDQPGEWYLDTQRGMAYLYPPTASAGSAELSSAQTVFFLDGTKHIVFRNLTLDESRGDLFIARNADDVRIEGAALRNAGRAAIRISGLNSGVSNCDISYSGGEGIWLSGGDRQTLQAGGLYAADNRVSHFGRTYRTNHPGIYIEGVGVHVEHNTLSEAPHVAILFNGNDHYIAHNEIFNVALETGDAGAIYSGRDWTARGTVIEDNFFHDITGVGIGAMGVYLDDQISGTMVRSNGFVRVKYGVLLGGGSDNVIVDNLFVQTETPIFFDARGMTFTKKNTLDPNYAFQQRLRAVPFNSGAYAKEYPTLANIEKDGLGVAMRNTLKGNLSVQSGDWHVDLPPGVIAHQSLTANWSTSDPNSIFRNDLSLGAERRPESFDPRPDSPWIKQGFVAPSFKDVGPRPRRPQ